MTKTASDSDSVLCPKENPGCLHDMCSLFRRTAWKNSDSMNIGVLGVVVSRIKLLNLQIARFR